MAELYRAQGRYYNQGQYAKSQPLYGRALAIFEKEHPEVAVSLNDLAALLRPCSPYETSGSSWCL
jgi:hypothetical protein